MIWIFLRFEPKARIYVPFKFSLFAPLITEHEEPQEVIFLHGIWRHITEFGIEGQIPRISSPVKLEKRC